MINAKLMQLVVNASNDGIVIAEREGKDKPLIYVNPAFQCGRCRLFSRRLLKC